MPDAESPRRKPRPTEPRQHMPERAARERVGDFFEVATGFNAAMAVAEAERCLQCKKPLCIEGCPVGIDIPAFINHVAERDFAAAVRRIKLDTNLPAICGRVCPQETQCEEKCIVGRKHKPVSIGALERFIADEERERGEISVPEVATPTGKRVAVVGSGPAGLTVAGELARRGHAVTIYEALHEPGGVLVYGIPEFRLPKEIVGREVDLLRRMGVEIQLNVLIGQALMVDDLFARGADAVFIGTGAGLPYFLNIPGENLNGIYSANEFLTRVNLMKAYRFPDYHTPVFVGKRVAVFGGGNTAMDSARTALRLGPESVKLIYRRSEAEMPARTEEIAHGKDEGIDFVMLAAPLEFIDRGDGWIGGVRVVHMMLGEPDASGRRRPVPITGSEEVIPVDTAVIAIGNGPNKLIPRTTPGLETSSHGTIVAAERTGLTMRPAVFAGGDIVTGAATVIQAMGAGKAAALAIDEFLMHRVDREAQARCEDKLRDYFRPDSPEHTDAERIEILRALGVTNAAEFLERRLPQWRARVDELLDPDSVDLMPMHISHAHARYVRGAIQELPATARARLFRTKLERTGLMNAVREIWGLAGLVEPGDGFVVHSADLLDDVRQSIRVIARDGGRALEFDVIRLNPEAEAIYAAVADAVGAVHCPTVVHATPRGERVALQAVPEGALLADESAHPEEFFRKNWPWVVVRIAEQEALADFLGVAGREGYVVVPGAERVSAIEHLEIFHHVAEAGRLDEPALAYVLARALPDDPARRETVAAELIRRYETAYVERWRLIVERWDAVADRLRAISGLVATYTGAPVEETIQALAKVRRWNPVAHLTRCYEAHLPETWAAVGRSIWEWRRSQG